MLLTLKRLFYLFDRATHLQLLLLFGLMILISILEAAGIGLVVPFISIIEDPSIVESNKWLYKVYELTGSESRRECLLYLSFGLIMFFFLKNTFLSVFYYFQLRFVFSKRTLFGKKLFSSYLKSPYTFHLHRHSAELLRNIGFEVPKVYIFVQSLLKLCTELFVLIFILGLLVSVNPLIAIISISVLGLASGAFYLAISGYTRILGERIQSAQKYCNQAVLEGFGAIKELKVSGTEGFFADRYYENMMKNARANWINSTLMAMPRLFLEVIGVGIVLLIVILLQDQGKEIKSILPTLGLFAVATIRLMPSFYQIVSNLQLIRFNSPAVDVIYHDMKEADSIDRDSLEIKQSVERPLVFKKEIKLENLTYSYPNSNGSALQEISLAIQKGETTAFVGVSGAGKTTLANVILGLLEPSKGKVYADDKDVFQHLVAWKRNIGYVPQSIYLLDASIRSNVAFGLEDKDIDNHKVWEALRIAQLEDFAKNLTEGLDTFVGENGVRLSGGQRQRLGIARAVYHQPEVLILDEATSALDSETEKEVSKAIEALSGQKTLIIIAHRLSTIRQCDNIFFMREGSIVDSGTFDMLVSKNPEFKRMADSGKL
jgi:ABC-type multidrug transport system fused ATPase/permease subunit